MPSLPLMDDQPAPPSDPAPRGAGLGSILIWIGIACVIYVLSVGPVGRVLSTWPNGFTILETVYAPLIFIADTIPPLHQFFRWYIELWANL